MRATLIRNCGLGIIALLPAIAAAQSPGWPYTMFDKADEHDFGFVARGAESRFRIRLVNTEQVPVHISFVGTRCECASARALQTTLPPGETGSIEVTFDTKKYQHERKTSVIVRFDQPRFAEVQIPVKVYIRSDVVIAPGEAAFGPVAKGTSPERRLNIAYAGRAGWAIKEVINHNRNVAVQLQETSRFGGSVNYELVVGLKPTAPAGELREQLILLTDDPGAPQIPVLVEARVEAPYSVTPELVDFGIVRPGERKDSRIVVRGKQPFLVETIESDKTAGVFEVRLPKDPRTYHVLPLTVIAPSEPGTLSEEFSITIQGVDEPLVFKAYCRIVPAAPGG